jgi:8-oxo-dGTP pyrophosphatase MutT (NUDIX family)
MTQMPFLIDAYGLFDGNQLRIEWREEPRAARAELDRLIERTWIEQLAASRRMGRHLFNGQLARYLRHQIRDGRLLIEVGPTDYAAFMGTNYLHPDRGDEFGWELYSNPIGTSATVITADGWLLYGRRNHKVACHPGYVHTLGGSLEAQDRREDGTLDAFSSMARELREEAGIRVEETSQLVCLGMIRDPFVRQPELIFDANVALTRDELSRRIHSGDEEHTSLVACLDQPRAMLAFIRETEKIAPIAVGALCLHGRRCFGEAWFEGIMRELPAPHPPHSPRE